MNAVNELVGGNGLGNFGVFCGVIDNWCLLVAVGDGLGLGTMRVLRGVVELKNCRLLGVFGNGVLQILNAVLLREFN